MTPDEQERLWQMRDNCADLGLCCWYFSLEGEVPAEYSTEEMEQAG